MRSKFRKACALLAHRLSARLALSLVSHLLGFVACRPADVPIDPESGDPVSVEAPSEVCARES